MFESLPLLLFQPPSITVNLTLLCPVHLRAPPIPQPGRVTHHLSCHIEHLRLTWPIFFCRILVLLPNHPGREQGRERTIDMQVTTWVCTLNASPLTNSWGPTPCWAFCQMLGILRRSCPQCSQETVLCHQQPPCAWGQHCPAPFWSCPFTCIRGWCYLGYVWVSLWPPLYKVPYGRMKSKI